MASDLTYVKGLPELAARLKALPAEIAKKALRRGVAAGASVVRRQAVANAPLGKSATKRGRYRVQPGTLKRAAIIKFVKAESNDAQIKYIVTFRKGKNQQRTGRDAFYASWVEFGHKIVPRSKRAVTVAGVYKNRITLRSRRASAGGQVPPHRYLGPALEQTRGTAVDKMAAMIAADLQKIREFKP